MKIFALHSTQNKGFTIGKIHLLDNRLIFKPWFLSKKNEFEIPYNWIENIEKEFIHITKLLRVILKDNTTVAFSVYNRNKVKQFLENKL
ncbi:MAG: hypothetical protein H0X63_00725 [Flavobacteriales bacterium]|jgi:hypothetical protein|nr:hypothetical protein [Flavobacteriales bacterium]